MGQPDYGAALIAAEQDEPEQPFVPNFLQPTPNGETNAADVLQQMAETYRARNAVYGDNFRMVGPIMRILFPNGVSAEVLTADQFHLFELMLVKLSRFAISNLRHTDSIHDAAVYAAMIEAIINEQNSRHGR